MDDDSSYTKLNEAVHVQKADHESVQTTKARQDHVPDQEIVLILMEGDQGLALLFKILEPMIEDHIQEVRVLDLDHDPSMVAGIGTMNVIIDREETAIEMS